MTNDPFMILILILSQQNNLQPMISSSFLTNIHLLVSVFGAIMSTTSGLRTKSKKTYLRNVVIG